MDTLTKAISIGSLRIGGANPLLLIAGPCVIESEQLVLDTAARIREITDRVGMPFVFKSSYAKMNRMSRSSFSGPGLEEGLRILAKVGAEIKVPVLTDVHSPQEAVRAGEAVDIVQIPAFLCRQTDLAIAAGQTGKPVNIKKGQFLAPDDMGPITEKIASTGNTQLILTERGTTFGYHNLVVDMRSLVIMRRFGYPVVFDATHSIQLPGGEGTRSGGTPSFIAPLARAAVAAGVDGLFVETHPCVKEALCDASNMLPLELLEDLLEEVLALDNVRRNRSLSAAPASAVSPQVLAKAGRVRLLVLDVDGILTDGQVYFGSQGEMIKAFHVHDGKGIRLAQQAGIRVALISGRASEPTRQRAVELGIEDCSLGIGDKMSAYEALLRKHGLGDEQVAYMGDDVEDHDVMRRAGFSATVPAAGSSIKAEADYVTRARGGDGAVREVVDLIMGAQKRA